MILDKHLQVSDAQAVTASAASTDYIDKKAAGDVGMGKPLHMMITVDEAAQAAGAATVTFQIQCDDNSGFSSPKTVFQSGAIAKADLVPGYQLFMPMPIGLDEQFIRVYYSVGTGPLTAGKFTAHVVEGVQKSVAYPDAL